MTKRKLIAIISIVPIFVLFGFSKADLFNNSQFNSKAELAPLFNAVYELVKKDYVEQVNDKELMESAINGMLTSLDPHSGYLDQKAFDEMKMQTKGEFGGLGLEVTMVNGVVKVVSPIDDTPAYEAGMKAGDNIVSIDDEMVVGLTLNEAVEKMRGKPGTKVKLTVIREGKSEPLDFNITRQIIKVKPVKSRVESSDIVYLRVNTFSEKTSENLYQDMTKLINTNTKGIVLDLRNNPGGILEQAINVSNFFIESGDIVSTKGRAPESNMNFKATKEGFKTKLPVVILINSGSASASEIVAGALQDHKRAVIMGTKSFGKGSVQTVMQLPNNGAVKLTTSRYYTPKGRSIQAEGIEPDIVVEQAKVDFQDTKDKRIFNEASLNKHLNNDKTLKNDEKKPEVEDEVLKEKMHHATKGKKPQSLEDEMYAKDYQLARAVDLLKALNVYNTKK